MARLEIILRLYLLPYDADYPVICFDERPCFLIGDTVEGLAMQPGQVAKQDYEYTRHGSCCVLAAIEPLRGKRFAHIRPQRTKKEFALFMKELTQKIEFIFTPKHASWLNMIEIEFSVLAKQCLSRRIPCIKKLESEVLTFFKERSQKGIKINWQFTPKIARKKLNRRYCKVNSDNSKYA